MRAEYLTTVQRQPEALKTSANDVRAQLAALDPEPWRRGTLGVVGMGASAHACQLLVGLMGRHGHRAVALSAGAFAGAEGSFRPADAYVLISESGESVEVLDVAERLSGVPTLAISNVVPSPVTEATDASLELKCGVDSAVYTVGYTTTLQALALVAEWLGVTGPDIDVTEVPAHASALLAEDETIAVLADRVAGSRSVDVVGHGARLGSAGEMALMLREACRLPSGCYDTYEYLHGPMEWLDAESACIIFGSQREVDLARFVASTGATAVLVTVAQVAPIPGVHVITIPSVGLAAAIVLETLPMHRLLHEVATRRGLSIDGFRYHQDDRKVSTAK